MLGGRAGDHGEADGPVERALASGAAAERFARMVVALGGPRRLSSSVRIGTSPEAPVQLPVTPARRRSSLRWTSD